MRACREHVLSRLEWFDPYGLLQCVVSHSFTAVVANVGDSQWCSENLPASLWLRVLGRRPLRLHSAVADDKQRRDDMSTGELFWIAESVTGRRGRTADVDWWTGEGHSDAAEHRQHSDGCRTAPPGRRPRWGRGEGVDGHSVGLAEWRDWRCQSGCRPTQPNDGRVDGIVPQPLQRRRPINKVGTTAGRQVPTMSCAWSHH